MSGGRPENASGLSKNCPTCGLQLTPAATVCPRDGTSLTSSLNQDPAFEKYQMLEILGQGGMGVIYKARHLILNKFVAIKTLHSNLASPETIRRFQIEGKAASSLAHPNIVAVYDLGVTQFGQPFMVMEFVDGKTLADTLHENGKLTKREFYQVFMQVCQGLSLAHRKSVLHRDIKPSNIMIGTDSSAGEIDVRIMDFGIAKIMTDTDGGAAHLTKTGDAIGSPQYMSPEQTRGDKLDQRSDIYSLGCVMYEALTGSPPFQGKAVMDTMMMHLEKAPLSMKEASLGDDIDPTLESIVMRTLAKKPDDRYASIEELVAALTLARDGVESMVGGSESSQSAPDKRAPGKRSGDRSILENAKKSSTLLFVCLTLGLTAAIGGGLWLSKVSHEKSGQALKTTEPVTDTTSSARSQSAVKKSPTNNSNQTAAGQVPGESVRKDATTLNSFVLNWEPKNYKEEIERKLQKRSESIYLIPIFGNTRVNSSELKLLKDANWLTSIEIPHGDFDDVALESLSGLTHLTNLELPGNEQLVDLHALKTLTNLTSLKLASTGVNSTGVRNISLLKNLQFLDLTQTNIGAEDLAMLEKLPNLKVLELHKTRLDPQAIESLKAKLPQLQIIVESRIAPSEKNVIGIQSEANILILKKDWNQAEAVLKEAESTVQNDPAYDALKKAAFFMYLGDVKRMRHFYTQAADKFEVAEKILATAAPDSVLFANACFNRADVLEKSSAGHPELWNEAIKDRSKAIAIAQKLLPRIKSVTEQAQMQTSVVEGLRQLSLDYAETNEAQMAIDTAEKEQSWARKFGIPASLNVALYNTSIGDALKRSQHLTAAIPYFERADQFYREHSSQKLLGEPWRVRMKFIDILIEVSTSQTQARAEKLLKELDALSEPDLQDRRLVLKKLIELYTKERRSAESSVLEKRLHALDS